MKKLIIDKSDLRLIKFIVLMTLMPALFLLENHTVSYLLGILILELRAVYKSYRIFKMSHEQFVNSEYYCEIEFETRFSAAFFSYVWPVAWPLVSFLCVLLSLCAVPKILDKLYR